ncbi:MAG: hypothetical protein O7C98_02900 [Planctomycetota bacterium]|nr:hypothetical protein [Planctomycetota bacterium]
MRAAATLIPAAILLLAGLVAMDDGPVRARPEFARREAKACGFCHINPRGGGPRNRTGQEYARNNFSFPAKQGDLRDFRAKDRAAMVEVRKMLDAQHIPAAITKLSRMQRSVKGAAAKQVVRSELHTLDVKGEEVLGRARLLMRKKKYEEAVELLCMLALEYKGLSINAEAKAELKDLRRSREHKQLVRKEENEAKARRLYLDAALHRSNNKLKQAEAVLQKVLERYPGTRAAKQATEELKKLPPKPA